jgi:transglutaminase-like putative cysteine protease
MTDPANNTGPSDTDTPTAATLAPTPLIDSDHPAVIAFAQHHAQGADERERAVALYLAVRDGFRYDPYRVDLSPAGMKASRVLEIGYGWCVTKAALLAAAARALGIPARVGFADVRNHLSTERLRQALQTDLFIWHGYTELWLDGRWVKATPAFNLSLCERFGLLPLDWDGREDSLYHPYDRAGHRHMEYVNQRGSFDDVPLARIVADFAVTYPMWRELDPAQASFDADVARETA